MTNNELNQYILHYLEEDKTNSAIMLTGGWGTGKSYYIQNSLKPFLEKEENGKHQCIIVSLYGLKDTAEISKSIYLGTRLKFLNTTSEKATTAKFAGKTIVKGVAGFFGIDLSKDEESLQQLYESVDLSGKLIVLEDLERSGIGILEVLGYVNNLVEQDGIKVLLVANEDEIKEYKPIIEDNKEKKETAELLDRLTNHKNREFTDETLCYLKVKKKTVSDTIYFEKDYYTAIQEIIKLFKNEILNKFSDSKSINEILGLMSSCEIPNLRSFIFACQKTVDIYEKIATDEIKDEDFCKTIFFSLIVFSDKLKCGEDISWKTETDFSIELATDKYPLFRFCYDYVVNQTFDKKEIEISKKSLQTLRLYDKKKSAGDSDLSTIYNWHLNSECDVRKAVESITKRLKDESDISFFLYGGLAYQLICVKSIIGCDIEEAKNMLVKNLYNKGHMIDLHYLFTIINDFKPGSEELEEYNNLKEAMSISLLAQDRTIFDFDYQPYKIENFYNSVVQREGEIINNHVFLNRLDINKIVEMLKKCSSAEIDCFRGIFLALYNARNLNDFFADDKDAMKKLFNEVQKLQTYNGYDKIQKQQMAFFAENLKNILERF